MNSTKEMDRTILALIVRGAMDREAGSSKEMIRKLIGTKGDANFFFFGKDNNVRIFFKGFFSGIQIMGTVDRLIDLLKSDSELLQVKLSNFAEVMWDGLFDQMGTRMNEYYEELERIANSR